IWNALVAVVDASDDPATLVLATRAADDVGRLREMALLLKKKPDAVVRQVAHDTMAEDRLLPLLGLTTSEESLAVAFASCKDPAELARLVKQAVEAGCVGRLPGWLRQKDRALL